ncbi:MAG: redoxin domain-containing protein [Flavobacteriaceae bacterium]|nr:redoxin domain-containing protein [Flavobacteriaceae bacterium]
MKPFFLSSVFVFFTLMAWAQAPSKLPDFSITDIQGKSFSNANLPKGKYMLFIYFNPSCPHCQNAFKTLNSNIENLPGNLQIYSVSYKGVGPTQKFMVKYAPELFQLGNVTSLLELDDSFGAVFNVQRFPSIYLFDPYGKLVNFEEDASKVMNFKEKMVSQK